MTDILLWEKVKEIDEKVTFLINKLVEAEEKAKKEDKKQ